MAFLHQGRNSSNFIGLKYKSPFEIRPYKNKPCNHLINPASPIPDPVHWKYFQKIAEDPLVGVMLPVPSEKPAIWYVNDPQDELGLKLVLLSKMTVPIHPTVRPIRAVKPADIMDQLHITRENVS